MKLQRLTIGLTLLNLVILGVTLFRQGQPVSAAQSIVPPVLRAQGLEIVDTRGRIRAQILVHGPETVNSVTYPETVLLRLIDPKSGPIVKLTASENGAALGLSDDTTGGVSLYARREKGTFLRVVDKNGRERVIRP